jgi:hypothetical protein
MWWTKRSWSAEAEEARAKVESQEGSESLSSADKAKLTRRQALAKFGFQAGAAAIATLTADDLLRKVGEEMQKRAGDSEVANAVAKEFKNAGVAFATEAEPSPGCSDCTKDLAFCHTLSSTPGPGGAPSEKDMCLKAQYVQWCKCMKNNHCPGAPTIPQCSDCTTTGCP